MKQQELPLPDPGSWLTVGGAAFLLRVSRRTVERMIERGTLTRYAPYGALGEQVPPLLWRAEVNSVLDARLRLNAAKRDWSAR